MEDREQRFLVYFHWRIFFPELQGRGVASHWGRHIVFLPNRSDIGLCTSIFGGFSDELKDHEVCQLKSRVRLTSFVFYQVTTSSMSGKLLILIVTPPDICLCPRRAMNIL